MLAGSVKPPSSLAASAISSSQINLQWTDNSQNELGTKIERASSSAGPWTQVGTVGQSVTSYSSGGLSAGTIYYFRVVAYDSTGATAYSNTASATTRPDSTAPSTPTGLFASAASSSQINLSWGASSDTGGSGLAGYRVYRNGQLIGTTPATSYYSTGLGAGTQYCFTVVAYDRAGNASAQSSQACATTSSAGDFTAPSTPTGLFASAASSSQINLSWGAASDTGGSGLAGYRVYRNGQLIGTTPATTYYSTGLGAGTQYCFTVAAYDNASNSSAQSFQACASTSSAGDSTAPSTPTGLFASGASSSQINLSWGAASDTGGSGLAGYRVYRNGQLIGTTPATTYYSTGLAAGTQYCYSVAAYDNASNSSSQSLQACASTSSAGDSTAPSTPTGLFASAASSSQINLSWGASWDTGGSGLAGYRVYRNGQLIGTTPATTYYSTGLAAGTQYCYSVAAYDNASNSSSQSLQACASTSSAGDSTAPSTPTGLFASAASSSQINLSWGASWDTGGSGLAGYRVYRNGQLIGTTPATTYYSTGLAAGTQYCYSVAAYDNASNSSSQSFQACASTSSAGDSTDPSTPTGLFASAASSSQINLSWGASSDTGGSGLAGYRVYRNGQLIGTTPATTYYSTGLAAGTQYCYSVAAYDNASNASAQSLQACASTSSGADSTAPSKPTGLFASAASSSQINLSWGASSDTGGSGLAGYRVYRNGQLIGTTPATTYYSTGLGAGTQYCFTVAAYDNASNASAQSLQACASTSSAGDSTAPSVPSGVTAAAVSSSQINVSWNAATDTGGSGLAGYRLYRSGVLLGTTTGTAYYNSGIAAGTYCYTVTAYDHAGNASAQSLQVCATTGTAADVTAPTVPSGVSAVATSSSQVTLTWSSATDSGTSGLAGYRVYDKGVLLGYTPATTYYHTGLAAGTQHCYTVASYDNAGNISAQSLQSCATISSGADLTAPSVPTGVTAVAASSSQINVSWNSATDTGGSGLAGYRVYRAGTLVTTTTSRNYYNSGLAAGNYCYTVAAYDNAGNVSAQSVQVCASTTQTTTDIIAPNVSITSPGSGASVSGTTSLVAGASDNVGVTKVEFYYDSGTLVGTATAAPYSVAWTTTTVGNGTHNIYARAYDAAGNWATSTSVAVNVSNSVTPPPSGGGVYQWARQMACSTSSSFSYVNATAADSAGNVIAAGSYQGTVNTGAGPVACAGSMDIFLTKYTKDGSVLWSRHIGGVNDDVIQSMAVDSLGNILVMGFFTGTVDFGFGAVTSVGTTVPDIFLLKLSPQGNSVWFKQFGGTGDDKGFALAVDSRDNVVIAGYFGAFGSAVDFGFGPLSSAGGRDIFVAKYTSTGAPVWARRCGGAGDDWPTSIAVDRRDDSVVVTGNFMNTVDFGGTLLTCAGGRDIFLAKYSAAGAFAWAQRFGSADYEQAGGVAVDGNGNIALVGIFYGSVNFGSGLLTYNGVSDIFIAQFTSSGAGLWSKNFGSSLGSDQLLTVTTDTVGNVIFAGSINSNVDFGGGRLWGLSPVSPDLLVAKFTNRGDYVWAKRYGGGFPDVIRSVTTDQQNNVIAGGFYATSVDFGGGPMTTGNRDTGCVVKLSP